MVDLHKKEHSFSAFTFGVAVGIGAALLFGTEDGRKLAKKVLDNLPDTIKNLPNKNDPVIPDSDPESTPHTYIAQNSPPQFPSTY